MKALLIKELRYRLFMIRALYRPLAYAASSAGGFANYSAAAYDNYVAPGVGVVLQGNQLVAEVMNGYVNSPL